MKQLSREENLTLFNMIRAVLCLAFIWFLTSCSSSPETKTAWTETYERNLNNRIDGELKFYVPRDDKRAELVAFIVKRLKAELPNGVESISPDSLLKLSNKIGVEYGLLKAGKEDIGMVPTARPWTKEFESGLKKVFVSELSKDGIENGEELCNCLIAKLKIIYPDSVIVPFDKKVIFSATTECAEEMKK